MQSTTCPETWDAFWSTATPVQDSYSSLWQMGLEYVAAAREIMNNHVAIAKETNNNFTKSRCVRARACMCGHECCVVAQLPRP